MSKPLTKQGAHGKLYRYEIEYKDPDPGCPVFEWRCWAYNSEHAIEKFYEGPEDNDWELLRIARMSDRPRSSWKWTKL